nr:MAG TPA: Extended Signal Peptide of Type V secretion system [Inoviridae sp.]
MKIKLLNINRIYRLIFRKARRCWICRFCFRFFRLI